MLKIQFQIIMVAISFPSENPLGECPGAMEGDFSKTKKGLIVLQVGVFIHIELRCENTCT